MREQTHHQPIALTIEVHNCLFYLVQLLLEASLQVVYPSFLSSNVRKLKYDILLFLYTFLCELNKSRQFGSMSDMISSNLFGFF